MASTLPTIRQLGEQPVTLYGVAGPERQLYRLAVYSSISHPADPGVAELDLAAGWVSNPQARLWCHRYGFSAAIYHFRELLVQEEFWLYLTEAELRLDENFPMNESRLVESATATLRYRELKSYPITERIVG